MNPISDCYRIQRGLKRTRAEEELDDIALVRLQPVEPDGRDGADIQAVDVRGVE